jgi:4-hydroxybenzoyl-CoA thioesterase
MSSFMHRRELRIEWGHCDPAGIVFYPRFLEMFDWSTWLLVEAATGVPMQKFGAQFGVEGFPLVDVKVRFTNPCRVGDSVVIESHVETARRSSFQVAHRLSNAGVASVACEETRVWAVRGEGSPIKLVSAPIPNEVRRRFGLPDSDFENRKNAK